MSVENLQEQLAAMYDEQASHEAVFAAAYDANNDAQGAEKANAQATFEREEARKYVDL